MSVNVNLEDYQIAQELLDSSQELFESTSNEVNSVVKTLDRKVLAYVEKDLNNAGESIHLLKANEADISGEITTHASKIVDIEGKAMQDLAAITGATEVEETEKQTHHVWDEGKEALSSLGDVALSVTKSLVSVGAAAVKGAFSLLTFNLGGLFDSCKTVLEAAVHIGTKVVSFVKESFDFLASFFASAVASIANLITSLVEGIVSFVEALGDAALMIVGAAASILTGLADGIHWIGSKIFGYEFTSLTKAMWTKGIMPAVGYNWSGALFDKLYETPLYTWIETNSFGPFKREGGLIYEIGKGVGYTIGMVIASICTCGAASAAGIAGVTTTGVTTAMAGLGAFGKNTQKGYNKLSDEEKESMGSIAKVLGYGVGSGVIEAGAWYLTFGGGSKILQNTFPKFLGATAKPANFIANGFNKVFGTSVSFNAGNMGKVFVQFGKTYANASNKYFFLTDDQSVGGYFKDVWLNTENLTDAAIAGGISLLYDASAGKYVKDIGAKVSKWFTPEATQTATTGGESIYSEGVQEAVKTPFSMQHYMPNLSDDMVAGIAGGFGKIAGGFIKKFYDPRNLWDIVVPSAD